MLHVVSLTTIFDFEWGFFLVTKGGRERFGSGGRAGGPLEVGERKESLGIMGQRGSACCGM